MQWIVLRLIAWIAVFLAALFVLEPTDTEQTVYVGIIAFVIVYGVRILSSIWNYIRSLFSRILMRLTTPRRHRPTSRRQQIAILDLQLLVESGDPAEPIRKLGMLVNPNTDFAIRPYLVIKVNRKKLEGRQITIRFEIVSPREKVKFETTSTFALKYGEDRIVPRDSFIIPKKFAKGTWTIRVLAGNKLLETKEFLVTDVTLEGIAQQLDGDMQAGSSVRYEAGKLEKADPQAILGDMLE